MWLDGCEIHPANFRTSPQGCQSPLISAEKAALPRGGSAQQLWVPKPNQMALGVMCSHVTPDIYLKNTWRWTPLTFTEIRIRGIPLGLRDLSDVTIGCPIPGGTLRSRPTQPFCDSMTFGQLGLSRQLGAAGYLQTVHPPLPRLNELLFESMSSYYCHGLI